MRRVPEYLLLLSFLLAFSACQTDPGDTADSAPTSPVPGGTAVIGVISDVEVWNEYLARQTSSLRVLRRMYLQLAREEKKADGSSRFQPRLAESWSRSDDGLALTFRLRETTWSDGVPVTAEDVLFTWQAQISPEVAWLNADVKSAIRNVTIDDPRTVTFHFANRYPEMMADATEGGILPRHVFNQIPFAEWITHDWSTARVGSGPFLLAHHDPGTEIRLSRNPNYHEPGRPYIDELVFRIVPDRGNLLLQLRAGAIDLVEGIPPAQAGSLEVSGEVQLFELESVNYDYIGWNGSRPPLDDPEVRRAMTLAIDRRGIVEELLYGHGVVSAGPVPSSYRVKLAVSPWPYAPDEASAILQRKGYQLQDGVLVRDGKPLAIEMTTNAGNEIRKLVLTRIQEQLGRLGVQVELLPPMQMRAFVKKHLSGDFDAYVGGWAFSGKVEFHTLFGSDAIPPNGSNLVQYSSEQTDAALADLEAATTPEEMLAPLERLQGQIHKDQPYTFLYESWKLAGASSRLQGLSFTVPVDPLAGLEDAWVD